MKVVEKTTLLFVLMLLPFGSFGWDPEQQAKESQQAAKTIATFKEKDKGIQRFFNSAYGYAVFPTVGKGGIGIGGAYGKGQVYQRGKIIGSAKLTQITIGFQLGGQTYSEIIFFKDKKAMDRFKESKLELSAQLSAVAVTAGAAANANYESGVAVFTLVKGGLMYEASVGGQSFSFTPR
jgi:lipid-binding SYLF domain-containing protein